MKNSGSTVLKFKSADGPAAVVFAGSAARKLPNNGRLDARFMQRVSLGLILVLALRFTVFIARISRGFRS